MSLVMRKSLEIFRYRTANQLQGTQQNEITEGYDELLNLEVQLGHLKEKEKYFSFEV